MKHIVTLTISNPAHEHISLRRRQSTTNYMVEARDEAEAIFRASNHFKKLGNYVHNAVIAESTLNEEVEQIDELKKSTLASYITKASRQSGALHSLGKEFDNDKYMYAKKALNARTPKTKEQAKTNMETSGKLANRFTRKAYNRVAGVSLAAAKLAKEEVESIDEVNARHSPEAAQAVLTPTAKVVRAAVGKTARDKASTKKYARRVAKISPDYSKKDVMGSLKSMGEEVEQIDEKAPPGAKYERMVKHIKNQYSKDGTLTPQEKAIAYATAWKAKNSGK